MLLFCVVEAGGFVSAPLSSTTPHPRDVSTSIRSCWPSHMASRRGVSWVVCTESRLPISGERPRT